MSLPAAPLILTTTAVVGALAGYRLERHALYGVCKAAASAGFVWLAISGGMPGQTWARFALAALGLAALGDLVLIGRGKRAFAGGMALFFGAHVAFLTAFLVIGPERPILLAAIIPLGVFALTIRKPITGRAPRTLAAAVTAYMALLTVSVSTGIASAWTLSSVTLGLGITLVGLSDVAVVRERFIHAAFGNKVVGLSAYYAGQLLIASVVLLRG